MLKTQAAATRARTDSHRVVPPLPNYYPTIELDAVWKIVGENEAHSRLMGQARGRHFLAMVFSDEATAMLGGDAPGVRKRLLQYFAGAYGMAHAGDGGPEVPWQDLPKSQEFKKLWEWAKSSPLAASTGPFIACSTHLKANRADNGEIFLHFASLVMPEAGSKGLRYRVALVPQDVGTELLMALSAMRSQDLAWALEQNPPEVSAAIQARAELKSLRLILLRGLGSSRLNAVKTFNSVLADLVERWRVSAEAEASALVRSLTKQAREDFDILERKASSRWQATFTDPDHAVPTTTRHATFISILYTQWHNVPVRTYVYETPGTYSDAETLVPKGFPPAHRKSNQERELEDKLMATEAEGPSNESSRSKRDIRAELREKFPLSWEAFGMERRESLEDRSRRLGLRSEPKDGEPAKWDFSRSTAAFRGERREPFHERRRRLGLVSQEPDKQ